MSFSSVPAVPVTEPKGDVANILLEVRSLSEMMKTRVCKQRPRFPFACKNGPSCPFLACGSCWFRHEGDDVDLQSTANKPTTVSNNKDEKQLKALDMKITDFQNHVDSKLASLSSYIDQQLANVFGKLDALAEATFQNETDITELSAISAKAGREAPCVAKDLQSSSAFVELQAEIAKEIEAKFDSKLQVGLDQMRSLIQALVEALGDKVGKKIRSLEDKLQGVVEDRRSEQLSEPVATGG
jgi:hypothetical protein